MRAEVAFEPLTALAGGIIGGAIVAFFAWRRLWREIEHRTHHPRGAAA